MADETAEQPMDGGRILNLPMGENDAGASTIGDYLKRLLLLVWEEGEGFDGKRPFGNSGWECDLHGALIRGGAVEPDDHGDLDADGEDVADRLVRSAIERAFTA